jgi:two-component system sensor histidine kinase PilS (NtrC family)
MVHPLAVERQSSPAAPGLVAPEGAEPQGDPVLGTTQGRRLTYFLLLRVLVTTLLMLVAFASELAEPSLTVTPKAKLLFTLIGLTYATALIAALLLRQGRGLHWLVPAQASFDMVAITAVVHATGGADSGFVFLYLLSIVATALVLPGLGMALAAFGSALAYVGISMAGRFGWVPLIPGELHFETPLGTILRTLFANLVAFAATTVLARRLATELERAGKRIVAQGTRLAELQAHHAEVIESLTSGLLTVTTHGQVATCNRAAVELLGLEMSGGMAPGRPLTELLPGLPEIPPGGTLRRVEVMVRRSDGSERCFGVSVSPLLTATSGALRPVGSVVNFQDVTELQRMREQVQRAQQLAALGRMAAGVAHEIRNPLAAISGAIELLGATAGQDGEEQQELMGIVTREVARLDYLIAELLDFARPRPPHLHPVELAGAVREFARVLAADLRLGGRRLELQLEEPVWIQADPGQLRQVLWNLARNAAEASPREAPIALSVSTVTLPRRWAVFSIRDHGHGIPAEGLGRLFEPFFTTKQSGTGLGLAIVHRIVVEHHGEIDVRTPPDGGAEFVIHLPLAELPASA